MFCESASSDFASPELIITDDLYSSAWNTASLLAFNGSKNARVCLTSVFHPCLSQAPRSVDGLRVHDLVFD